MENSKSIDEKRASVSEILSKSLIAVEGVKGMGTMRYNGLVFCQDISGLWYEIRKEVEMSFDQVVDMCLADDHRRANERTCAMLYGLAGQLARLLPWSTVKSGVSDKILNTTSVKYLRVVDKYKGVLGVSDHPDAEPTDFMLYHPNTEKLDHDNRPNGDHDRQTVGEVMRDFQAVWADEENKRIELRIGLLTFTFFPDLTNRLSATVTDSDGVALCRFSAY